ncbi:TetR/AcrR family transcriptional regulator [Pseudonocardia sp. KRD-291]|nr:TetR/AcrR family transcriptional regulator [Pseudonocardia sp. KRD291]
MGFRNASLGAIAHMSAISKGVNPYQFSGKEELMEACVDRVYASIAERAISQLEQLTPLEFVREHILAVARDDLAHREDLVAGTEIVTHLRRKDGRRRYSMADNEGLYRTLEQKYEAVSAMRVFDHRVMAVTVQSALDSMFGYWITFPEHDLIAHTEQLANLVVAAIRVP